MLTYKRQISLRDDKEMEDTSASLVVSCNACVKERFAAVADSADTDDTEGCDFALTIAAGSSIMGVPEKDGKGCAGGNTR
jgi:hypothetical protein